MDNAATDTMRTLSDQVAEEIRVILTRRRMSQRQLAQALGVSPAWLNYRLTGVQAIDLNDLQRIANVLQVPVTALLPAVFRPNDRSDASPVRATPKPRPATTRPKGRPANAATRPASPGPSTRRRPARIDRPGSR